MNKVFPGLQRKDKDLFTGRYTHSAQETGQVSPTQPRRWPLAGVCLGLIALAVLAALLL